MSLFPEKPKVVILAGGFGTRIAEESDLRPKPLVEIGGKPIILHIMEQYSRFGFNEFVVCVGYLGHLIKDYFLNLSTNTSDFTIELENGSVSTLKESVYDWKVTIVDTGIETMTGGRLRRVRDHLGDTFFLTYGDGISTVDFREELRFHREHGKRATVVAVRPPARFAVLGFGEQGLVDSFREKPVDEAGWISGGFFVLDRSVIDLIEDDATIWEGRPMEQLVAGEDLVAFPHLGFWQPMDSLRDKRLLEKAWNDRQGPWRENSGT
jgi:glucose-1-phosphate cytidylyltransferase